MLFDTAHFNPLMMDSGEMSFQAVLIYCPSSKSDGLMFHAGVSGNLQIAAILQTGNIDDC
jgi:hypothetical protein